MPRPTLMDQPPPDVQRDLTGIPLALYASDPAFEIGIEMATDAAFTLNVRTDRVLGTHTLYIDRLPDDGITRYYRIRHVRAGYTDSAWTSAVAGVPFRIPPYLQMAASVAIEGRRRTETLYDQDGLLRGSVQVRDTTGMTTVVRGRQTGSCRHGDSVSFNPPFQNAPLVLIRGGIDYQPDAARWTGGAAYSATRPQYQDYGADGLSSSGFTARARLRQKNVTITARTANFPAGNSLTTVGASSVDGSGNGAVLASAPSNTDEYTAHFSVALSATADPAPGPGYSHTWVVAIDSRPDGASAWTERGTRSFAQSVEAGASLTDTYANEELVVLVVGLTTTAQVRVRIKSQSESGLGAGSCTVHAFDGVSDPVAGVTYNTSAAADTYASKTPDTDDRVYWEAMEVESPT